MKILILDSASDDALLLERLCHEILGEQLEHAARVTSSAAAAREVESGEFDVVLLNPPAEAGPDLEALAGQLGGPARTIVVSDRTDLALPAFDCGVLDFVPKPVARERLAKALHRARRPRLPADRADRFLAVRRSGRIDLVSLEDLVYVEGADKYSELVFANGRRNFHDTALGRLEATLPHTFVRIHKSYLVRFAMVSRLLVLKGSRYFAELKNGQRLPIGRSHYERVKSRLLWPAQLRRP